MLDSVKRIRLKPLRVEGTEERVGARVGDRDAAKGSQQMSELQVLEVRRFKVRRNSAKVQFAFAHLEGDGRWKRDRVHLQEKEQQELSVPLYPVETGKEMFNSAAI